ncbi:MAG: hypothetical protein GY906_31620 [bacterium]|nr:hypothetical protein [bacterium]
MNWDNVGGVRYQCKPGHDRSPQLRRDPLETFDPIDFLARVIMHIPDPRRHLVRYYGWYSNVSRGKRRKEEEGDGAGSLDGETSIRGRRREEDPDARALRKSWAQLIKRIYEVDPLVCPSCGAEMKVIAFIIDHVVVDKISRHLRRADAASERGPPQNAAVPSAS